eukprot:3948759-Ditylum_brightwellii.AAC.1
MAIMDDMKEELICVWVAANGMPMAHTLTANRMATAMKMDIMVTTTSYYNFETHTYYDYQTNNDNTTQSH